MADWLLIVTDTVDVVHGNQTRRGVALSPGADPTQVIGVADGQHLPLGWDVLELSHASTAALDPSATLAVEIVQLKESERA